MLKLHSPKFQCPLFVHDDYSLILLPCFFSHFTSKNGAIFSISETRDHRGFISSELVSKDVDEKTISIILNRLHFFLRWVEEYSFQSSFVSLSTHHNLPNQIINYYINDFLISDRKTSEVAIQQHLMALNAYFNYLAHAGFTTTKRLFVRPELKAVARTNLNARTAIKYLTPELRSILYQNTKSIRDELLLKTGGELGFRSKENQGFLLDDFYVGAKKYKGLLSLFEDLDDKPNQMEFEYLLQGLFTKSKRHCGGAARRVFIHRDLLIRMREYFNTERPSTKENTFFVNSSASNFGTPISKSRASRVFREVRDQVLEKQSNGLLPKEGQELEESHTHHVLRHSFGTDKFYQLSEEGGVSVDDVTPTSQVYLSVASLMGHNAADGSAPKTTRLYIRSCHIKALFEMDRNYE